MLLYKSRTNIRLQAPSVGSAVLMITNHYSILLNTLYNSLGQCRHLGPSRLLSIRQLSSYMTSDKSIRQARSTFFFLTPPCIYLTGNVMSGGFRSADQYANCLTVHLTHKTILILAVFLKVDGFISTLLKKHNLNLRIKTNRFLCRNLNLGIKTGLYAEIEINFWTMMNKFWTCNEMT